MMFGQLEKKGAEGLIFDMDGVIFETESIWKEGFQLANKKFNLNFTELDRQNCCGKDEKSIRIELKKNYPELHVDEYRDFIIQYVENIIKTEGAPLKNGFCEIMNYLHISKIKTALATSSKRLRALTLFEKRGLSPSTIFQGLIFSEDVANSKPNPEIFLLAAKKMRLAPESCIVLEDSINGVEAAVRGGFSVIMVKDLIEPTDEIKKKCLFVADNLLEVLNYIKGVPDERN